MTMPATSSAPLPSANRAANIIRLDWVYALIILAYAALLRLVFFRGALGTDEIVYITRAYQLLDGDQVPATYIGALRYGINAFEALSLWLFGAGLAGADGLFFICSLGSILLAYAFAHHLWGVRAAIWAALALATVPNDVTLAGGLNPDAYLALIISASVVLFYFAQQTDRATLFFAAGLLAGWVFWIKEAVILYAGIFALFALSDSSAGRRWRSGWWWFMLAALLCLIAHLALFWALYGDPLYLFGVLHRTVDETYIGGDTADTSLSTYFILLFVKIYHTGLLGWLALAGGILALVRRREPGVRFVMIWAVGLLLIFSAFPISFSPLKFIGKTSMYMEIFTLPLTLLAGWFLAQQRSIIALFLGGAMVISGTLLAALEQQVVRVVSVNGRAAAGFAEAHAGIPVFGPLTAQRQSAIERLLRGSRDGSTDIRPVADLREVAFSSGVAGDIVAYLIEDPQMRYWPGARTDRPLPPALRQCLRDIGPLAPVDLGLGRQVVAALRGVVSVLPARYAAAALGATDPMWQVAPAQVYAVTRECARQAGS